MIGMDRKEVLKKSKFINISVIILTIVLFLTYLIIGRVIENPQDYVEIALIISLVILGISIALLIYSIYLKIKNPEIKGLNFMILSAGCLAFFAFTGYMAGIVVFVLSTLSMSATKKDIAEYDMLANEERDLL